MADYDYIIVGTGCAGLSLAVRLIQSGKFASKKILLVDRVEKNLNDRTWCFWEAGTGYFESIVYHHWQELWVKHAAGQVLLNMEDYRYKMVRGIDFYAFCFDIINKVTNVTVRYGEVTAIDTDQGLVTIDGEQVKGGLIFSSVLLEMPLLQPKHFYLLQHFRGWWIETDTDFFEPAKADLMNFCTSQQHGCTFVYVLPVTKRKALIEYTLFSEELLATEAYDMGLKEFISTQLQLKNYKVAEIENGVIPMTNMPFPAQQGKAVFIGTAGGQTKASTGYTFKFIQQQSDALVAALIKQEVPKAMSVNKRFSFYDSVLLRVLKERKISGADLFYYLFKKNKTTRLLRFLDNEPNLLGELAIMNSTKKSIFIPAAIKELI